MSSAIVTAQTMLRDAGFDPGPLDGKWGPRTRDALAAALAIAKRPPPVDSLVAEARKVASPLIKRWEGCHLTAYPDPGTGGDPWTIGRGATGPGIRKGVVWTQQQADDRFEADLSRFMDGVKDAVTAPMLPRELAAMTSLAYNIGLSGFAKSTLLRRFNEGKTAEAAAEFERWTRAGGRVMQGLVNRRKDERAVFEGVK